MCKPMGCLRKLFGNPNFNKVMNLLLNLLSMVTLFFTTYESIASQGDCDNVYAEFAPTSGWLYARWLEFGAALSAILGCVTAFTTVVEALIDFDCYEPNPDKFECDDALASLSRWCLSSKEYFLQITTAVEPLLLIYLQSVIVMETGVASDAINAMWGANHSEGLDVLQYGSNTTEVLTAVSGAINSGLDAATNELREASAAATTILQQGHKCVDDRYKLMAATGTGALIASWQKSIRTYLEVGRMVRELLEDQDHPKYDEAYDVAKRQFGTLGAVLILVGFCEGRDDMVPFIRAALPEEAERMAEDFGVLPDEHDEQSKVLRHANNARRMALGFDPR